MRGISVLERLLSKVSVPVSGGCWLWEGARTNSGYGALWDGKRMMLAHRLSYEMSKGAIPAGLSIDHLCRVRHCVNPEHLGAVTHSENCKRGETGVHNKLKTHCPRGHPYSGENLIVRTYGKKVEYRECRECVKLSKIKRRQLCGN